jgi:hypothetical protein
MQNILEEANKRFSGEQNRVFRNYYIAQILGVTSNFKTEETFVHSKQICIRSICFGPHELDGRNHLLKEDLINYLNRVFGGSDNAAIERELNYLIELTYKDTEFKDCISTFLAQRQLSFKGQLCNTDGSCEYITLGKSQQSSSWPFPGADAGELPGYFSSVDRLALSDSTSFGTLQSQYESNAVNSIGTVALAAVGMHLFFKAAKCVSSLVQSALGYSDIEEQETDSSDQCKIE